MKICPNCHNYVQLSEPPAQPRVTFGHWFLGVFAGVWAGSMLAFALPRIAFMGFMAGAVALIIVMGHFYRHIENKKTEWKEKLINWRATLQCANCGWSLQEPKMMPRQQRLTFRKDD